MFIIKKKKNTELRTPRNSIAIPFLYQITQVLWKPLNNVYRLMELGKISSGLLHDLMGSVTAITIYTSQLKENDPKTRAVIESSKKVEELIELIREQIKNTEHSEFISVKESINNVMELLKNKAIKNKVRLISITNTDLKIFGRKIFFYQIIMNLISNAIESYNSDKFIKRNIIVKTQVENNNMVISIRDFGCGMNKKEQKKIFRCFYSKKENGTGIGLFVVYGMLKKHFKGKIKFSSEPNKGSVFYLSIPLNSPTPRAWSGVQK
jgi:signal transduction histidine kinase